VGYATVLQMQKFEYYYSQHTRNMLRGTFCTNHYLLFVVEYVTKYFLMQRASTGIIICVCNCFQVKSIMIHK
jgi:hypothetical protein